MKPLLTVALFLLLTALFDPRVHAEDDAAARTVFDGLLAAQDSKDYDAFVSHAADILKAALTRTQFDASSDIMKKMSVGGREITFLGELNQHGYEIYLYRLRFKSGDLLGTMSLDKDGKVAGIWFK